jgi:hypothetical protein
MAFNKTIRARRGETDFCFHTPLYDANGAVVDLDDIDLPNCDFKLWVAPKAGGEAIIEGADMTAHPDQVAFLNHIAYFASESEMNSPAGDYNWQIVFTDPNGTVTTYPKDGDDNYGLFRLLPTLVPEAP